MGTFLISKEIANNAICNDLVYKFLLLFGSQFSKVQETQVCFMLSVPTTMPRLSVVDRGCAVGMLEAGMAALALHATTICRRHAYQTARERPGLHQDGIGDQTVRNRLRAANLRCRRSYRGPILTNDNRLQWFNRYQVLRFFFWLV